MEYAEKSAGNATVISNSVGSSFTEKGADMATQPQIRKIMAAARDSGILIADVGTYMKAKWRLTSTRDLTKKQAIELIDLIEGSKFRDELDNAKGLQLGTIVNEEPMETAEATAK
jgi:hypothetical protein